MVLQFYNDGMELDNARRYINIYGHAANEGMDSYP